MKLRKPPLNSCLFQSFTSGHEPAENDHTLCCFFHFPDETHSLSGLPTGSDTLIDSRSSEEIEARERWKRRPSLIMTGIQTSFSIAQNRLQRVHRSKFIAPEFQQTGRVYGR
jgi:hypothetical protein